MGVISFRKKYFSILSVVLLMFAAAWPILHASVVWAHSGGVLGPAWTSTPPTIDGIIDAGEWSSADTEAFTIATSYAGTLYVMNDDTNVYLALSITDDDWGTDLNTRDFVLIFFDNDHDGYGPELGDDAIGFITTGVTSPDLGFIYLIDQFWRPQSGFTWDALYDGTDDGEAAGTFNGTYNLFEISHPLNDVDDDHDFSLFFGDTVGFSMIYADNNEIVGRWPESSSQSGWNDLVIASPIPAPVPEFGVASSIIAAVALFSFTLATAILSKKKTRL